MLWFTHDFLEDFIAPTDMVWNVLLNNNSQSLNCILRSAESSKCQCLSNNRSQWVSADMIQHVSQLPPQCDGPPKYVYVGFSRRKIPRSSTYAISEKTIQLQHPDYDPDRAQKLISSSMSRHLSRRNISSKSMHAFLSNLAIRQTDKQTYRQTNTSKNIYLLLCNYQTYTTFHVISHKIHTICFC